ncbi:hypothetical protein L6164_033469 [Bauhinia variegata]|uniref:Uncharacterized protein n=1 Tax=Bauhinia variegata TaxID=167791 RepID=A0ACB9KS12_BAUVA|nr:hypothetical protein L6164_033469 [Bauhinia variegata]
MGKNQSSPPSSSSVFAQLKQRRFHLINETHSLKSKQKRHRSKRQQQLRGTETPIQSLLLKGHSATAKSLNERGS